MLKHQAVEFAVNRGFDIISISWTIKKVEGDPKHNNVDDINRLEMALERAVKQDILVFCSAPDIGASTSQILKSYYPFGCSSISNSIFKIGAAKADGSTYGWTGDSDSVDFILPGHNVKLKDGDSIHQEDDNPKTGSSVATALAAGLAALIIHCVRLAAIHNFYRRKNDSTAVSESSLKTIKRFDAMKEAFMKVSTEYTQKDRRLEVETFFGRPGREIDPDSGFSDEEKLEKIIQLARDLVSLNAQARNAGRSRLDMP
jgi:hypothetical protein